MAGTINMNKVNAPEADLKPNVEVAPVLTDQNSIQINPELTEDTKETASDCVAAEPEHGTKKHTCTYMGVGLWTDAHDTVWGHKDTHVFTDEEFATRDDIKYMIDYGAILHSES